MLSSTGVESREGENVWIDPRLAIGQLGLEDKWLCGIEECQGGVRKGIPFTGSPFRIGREAHEEEASWEGGKEGFIG